MTGFYVPLTASGRGAIAVIRIEADPDTLARLPISRIPARPDRPTLVAWRDPAGETPGVPGEISPDAPVVEEVVVRRLPMSVAMTPGGVALELCCHGGRAAIRRIERDCRRAGLDPVTPEWWTTQSIARDSPDDAAERAMAWRRFLRAPTARIAATFFDQSQGAIGRSLRRMAERLRTMPENGSADDPQRASPAEEFRRSLRRLRRLVPYGRRIVREPRVVLVGAPNVGKSSILNRLAGFDRAIVHGVPGTTRDVIGQRIVLDGIPIRIEDTAGLRASDDRLENAGMRRTRHAIRRADLIVEVVEYGATPMATPTVNAYPGVDASPRCPVIRVVNKTDLAGSSPNGTDAAAKHDSGTLGVSARTGDGLDRLASAILHRLIPTFPRPGEPVPFLPHHRRAIDDFYRPPGSPSDGERSGG